MAQACAAQSNITISLGREVDVASSGLECHELAQNQKHTFNADSFIHSSRVCMRRTNLNGTTRRQKLKFQKHISFFLCTVATYSSEIVTEIRLAIANLGNSFGRV